MALRNLELVRVTRRLRLPRPLRAGCASPASKHRQCERHSVKQIRSLILAHPRRSSRRNVRFQFWKHLGYCDCNVVLNQQRRKHRAHRRRGDACQANASSDDEFNIQAHCGLAGTPECHSSQPDNLLYRIFTGTEHPLDLHRLMDEGKILLVNLDKGRIGEGPAMILGAFLVSHIALAGISHSDQAVESRRDFFVYLDEFQTFATQSVINMMSELRKYRVGMVLANQHLSQLDPDVRDAIFGNAGTIISFRLGAADASYVAREFAPVFNAGDVISLPRFHIYLRLMIDGETARPFSAVTLPAEDMPIKVNPATVSNSSLLCSRQTKPFWEIGGRGAG